MAKDKERSINPAQQQRKAEKAKALKKGRAELQARRNEKLAKRNPDRIQRQIDDLKALEASGDIKTREKAILADLERDLKAVNKAREALGDKAPRYPSKSTQADNRQRNLLGKRGHDGHRKSEGRRHDSGSDTDESVRNIPWPRDSPPPVPKEFRRNRYEQQKATPPAVVEVKTTYESGPQIRDLKKEAVNRFVPNAVKRKQDAVRGHAGQLLEPEDMDRLEQEGYVPSGASRVDDASSNTAPKFSEYNPKNKQGLDRLKAEEAAFERELAMSDADSTMVSQAENVPAKLTHPSRHVEVEEVSDEDR